jgi:hypothetical protein
MVKVVWGNIDCLFGERHDICEHTVCGRNVELGTLKQVARTVALCSAGMQLVLRPS